jgi:hypothetical protein
MKHLAIAVAAALALAGCSGKDMKLPDWNWAAVSLEQDNFCAVSRKVTWSVNDTPDTIHQARTHNAKWDRLCGKQVASS